MAESGEILTKIVIPDGGKGQRVTTPGISTGQGGGSGNSGGSSGGNGGASTK